MFLHIAWGCRFENGLEFCIRKTGGVRIKTVVFFIFKDRQKFPLKMSFYYFFFFTLKDDV